MSRLGFGRIFYINLDRRPDRRVWIETQLRNAGVSATRFSAISATRDLAAGFRSTGSVGCVLSHRAIIETAWKEKWKSVLVFEDDAAILEPGSFGIKAEMAVRELSTMPWDLFYFYNISHESITSFKHIQKIKWTWATHAIAVHQRFYDAYLDLVRIEKKMDIDYMLARAEEPAKYATLQDLVVQRHTLGIETNDSNLKTGVF